MPTTRTPPHRTLLVTVGSTLFPSLTDAILSPPLLSLLGEQGISTLIVQYGRAEIPLSVRADIGVDAAGRGVREADVHVRVRVEVMRFTDDFEGLLARADYVISHAGSGSILSTLRRSPAPPLMVVPNSSLMDDHQSELADEMGRLGYLMVSGVEDLHDTLPRFLSKEWKEHFEPFPPMDRDKFRGIMDEMMGFS